MLLGVGESNAPGNELGPALAILSIDFPQGKPAKVARPMP